MTPHLLFIKVVDPDCLSTFDLALRTLKSPKYDTCPYVNKEDIKNAFAEYESRLDFSNIYTHLTDINNNIEGHFLAKQLPEIKTTVIDETCTPEIIDKILTANVSISHVCITVYGAGLDRSIALIQHIKKHFCKIPIYAGGVGVIYPEIYTVLDPDCICYGDGVPFLRSKLGLEPLDRNNYAIPSIVGPLKGLPINAQAVHLISQLGCFHNCDFCITPKFHKYLAFCDEKKIIDFLKQTSALFGQDGFVYVCDPNAFNPLPVWRNVFNYFIKNPNELEHQLFFGGPCSLSTLASLPLEEIQTKCPLKFFYVNYGIESTIGKGYAKNQKSPIQTIELLNRLGIITNHNYIIGLPHQSAQSIQEEIDNNLAYPSDLISVLTYKPIPKTDLFNILKKDGRLLGSDMPPEFYYMEGFLPFRHPKLGSGFAILRYAFEAYYQTEKKRPNGFARIGIKLFNLYQLSRSHLFLDSSIKMLKASEYARNAFILRMQNDQSIINAYDAEHRSLQLQIDTLRIHQKA